MNSLLAHPECAFVWGHCQHIAADGSPVPFRRKPLIEKDHYLMFLRTNYIRTPGSVIYRRDVLEAVGGFNASLRGSEEYDLHLRIARNFPIHCHNETVLEYREHGANSSRDSGMMLKDTMAVYRSQWGYVKGKKELEQSYRIGKRSWQDFLGGRLLGEVLGQLRSRKQRKQAVRGLLTLLRYYPRGLARHAYRKLYCIAFSVKG